MPLPLTSKETIVFPFQNQTYITIDIETVIRLHLAGDAVPVALYVFMTDDLRKQSMTPITDGNQILQGIQQGYSFYIKCATKYDKWQ